MRTVALMILAAGCAADPPASDTITVQRCGGSAASDSYTLGNVSFDAGDLLVEAQYIGGCKRHTFAACWDGSVIDTQPPMIDIVLTHDAHGDTCDAVVLQHVRIDVTPVASAIHQRTYLNVVGASGSLPGTSATVWLAPGEG